MEIGKGRYKALLRNTANKAEGRYMIKLPPKIWNKMEWKINEKLLVDVVKMGIESGIYIRKDERDG